MATSLPKYSHNLDGLVDTVALYRARINEPPRDSGDPVLVFVERHVMTNVISPTTLENVGNLKSLSSF